MNTFTERVLLALPDEYPKCGSFIGGGQNNCIDTGSYLSAIGGGGGYCPIVYANLGNYIKGNHSFVGGGQANCIIGANCSAILGGCGNQVQSDFPVVVGGCGNVIPAGCLYVGAFGCNIASFINCAFHANTYVAQNMYNANISGAPAPGTGMLYLCCLGAGCPCGVYIA